MSCASFVFFNFVTFMGMIFHVPTREGERERGDTVRLFVFVLSAVEGEISRVWQGAVTIDTDDAAGTRRGSDHVRR